MTWLHDLSATYESIAAMNGVDLLPLFHVTQLAHVEVRLSDAGEFLGAAALYPGQYTPIPITEGSAGRTGNAARPHGLADKLQYTAGDLPTHSDAPSRFDAYLSQLEDWCTSTPHRKSAAVLVYVQKRRLIADLIAAHVLHVDGQGRLLTRDDARTAGFNTSDLPPIFRALAQTAGQEDAVVRWRVEKAGEPLSATWEDVALQSSWVTFATLRSGQRGFCTVSGERDVAIATNHPKRIRHGADGAKLISSNDESNFTFRGRFTEAAQVTTVSSAVTQRAHLALRWLLERQGFRNGKDQVVVSWSLGAKEIPDPLADTDALFGDTEGAPTVPAGPRMDDVGQALGRRLSRLITGYQASLGLSDLVAVLALDSAVPGRMAVTYYQQLTGSDFLERVIDWHSCHAWWQSYSEDRRFVGAPSPREIATAAYGRRLDEKLSKATIERLLPCIVEGRQLPRDLVQAVVRRASSRASLDPWESDKVLGIACSIYRGFHRNRSYRMALEPERTSRDYLYGRLLAVAEHLEAKALYLSGEERATNAERMMQRFADRPFSTWRNIENALQPYRARLRASRPAELINMNKLLDDIHASFAPGTYADDGALSGEYLLAYHCQRQALWQMRVRGGAVSDGEESDSNTN